MRQLLSLCVLALLGSVGVGAAEPFPATRRPQLSQPSDARTPLLVERDRLAFQRIARIEAEKAKVPYDLVDAVMRVESGYDPDARGDLDEIGLMQVRPGTAAMLGFKRAEESLATPTVNIHYGARYLGEAWRLSGGNVCRALMKYRAGHGQELMSPLSANYCARAKAHLVSIKSPLAAGIGEVEAIPTVIKASPVPSLREPSGRRKTGAAFWTAFEARIKRINARIEARWHRQAAR